MGRVYIASFRNVAVTAAQDFFEIQCPTNASMSIHEIKITQSSDAGDLESEQLRFEVKRANGMTSGSGGSTMTPNKTHTGDAAFPSTIEINNTTQAVVGGGSLIILFEDNENIHNGWHYLPLPEDRLHFSPGEYLIVSLPAAPIDSLTMNGRVVLELLGG